MLFETKTITSLHLRCMMPVYSQLSLLTAFSSRFQQLDMNLCNICCWHLFCSLLLCSFRVSFPFWLIFTFPPRSFVLFSGVHILAA